MLFTVCFVSLYVHTCHTNIQVPGGVTDLFVWFLGVIIIFILFLLGG